MANQKYEVGYGKPPVHTQFKPGQSGNPKGRPKGAKNKRPKLNEERLKGIILDEAYRDITVRDGDRPLDLVGHNQLRLPAAMFLPPASGSTTA